MDLTELTILDGQMELQTQTASHAIMEVSLVLVVLIIELQRLFFNNNLKGNIPIAIGQLDSLSLITLGFDSVSGSIPAEFGDLQALQYLNINNTQLSGSIPPELGQLSKNYFLCFIA